MSSVRCDLLPINFSDASQFQLMSKRQVRRWFEQQPTAYLSSLDHWIYGFLVRLSHPRPQSSEQGAEFARLVQLFRAERPEIRMEAA